jgi:hypothetical protein
MNRIVIQAFYDELEKIAANWSVAGSQALNSHPSAAFAEGAVPQGHSGPNLSQHIQQREQEMSAHQQASTLREQKIQKMLDSGEYNPKTHTVDRQGNLTPRKPVAPPAGSTPTQVLKPGYHLSEPMSAGGTVIHSGPHTATAPGSVVSRIGSRLKQMRPTGKAGLGAAALGIAGLGGYALG